MTGTSYNILSKLSRRSLKNVFEFASKILIMSTLLIGMTAQGGQGSTSLLLSADQYINATENSENQNLYLDINRNYTIVQNQSVILEANLNWSNTEDHLYTQVMNSYYSLRDRNHSIDVGVKKLSWSQNMDFFHSQEWQQQLSRNSLHPITGGNLGVFYGVTQKNYALNIMYSPYFIPSRGAATEFQNGNITSGNPWFLAPPESVPYEGEQIDTRYYLNNPDLRNFLKEQSFATNFNLKEERWLLNVSYANKPSPKLLMDLDFTANVSQPEVPADVFINPRVARHQLISTDLSYLLNSKNSITLGYLNESFSNESFISKSVTYMTPNDQDVFTLVFTKSGSRYNLSLGGIYRQGGRSGAQGELASALVNQNVNYIFERAIKLDFTYFKTWGWSLNSSVSYDFLQKGLLTSVSLQRYIADAVLNLGFDALEPIRATDTSSFVYQYRNLDRVWAGVSCVF